MRLKNRNHSIPGGFKFTQAETNFEAPANLSFNGVVDAVVKHRLGNQWLVKKHNWSTDWNSVADEVESFNALRMQGNPKFHHFLGADDGGAPGFFHFPRASQLAGAVGAAARKTVAGVSVLLSWTGSGGRVVKQELAQQRAEVCKLCPLNQDGNFWQKIDAELGKQLKLIIGIKNDLKLKVDGEEKLKSCLGCDCWIPTKIWTPISHILSHTPDEIKRSLDSSCWILSEEKAQTK